MQWIYKRASGTHFEMLVLGSWKSSTQYFQLPAEALPTKPEVAIVRDTLVIAWTNSDIDTVPWTFILTLYTFFTYTI